MMTASALSEMAKGDPRALPALADALDRMTVGDHNRSMVARLLALHGDDGALALASATREAEAIADLVGTFFVYATDDPQVIDTFLDVVMRAETEDDKGAAMRGLIKIGESAIAPIEAAIAETDDEDHRQSLRQALYVIQN